MTKSVGLSRREFIGGAVAAGLLGPRIGAAEAAAAEPTAAAKPGPWQIGCYTRPWANCEFQAALDAIAEAGYKHIGLMTIKAKGGLIISPETSPEEAAKVGEQVRKRGLAIPSAWGGNIPVMPSAETGIAALRRLIDNCAAAGVANVLMGGVGDPASYATYYKAVRECCDYAAEKKVGISIKPHGGLNSTGPQCRKTIEEVGHKNFRLWYDPGNIYYYSNGELDPAADAATVDGIVVGMSVKDYVHPKKVDVTPGTGKVDFKAVMARLKKGGFTGGALVVECLAPGDPAATLAEARKARQFVEELVAGLA